MSLMIGWQGEEELGNKVDALLDEFAEANRTTRVEATCWLVHWIGIAIANTHRDDSVAMQLSYEKVRAALESGKNEGYRIFHAMDELKKSFPDQSWQAAIKGEHNAERTPDPGD